MSASDTPESYIEPPDHTPYEDALPWESVSVPVTDSSPRTHVLKVVPPYFDAIVSGAKTFEVRRNDRGYQRGDVLRLREWHPHQTNSARVCKEPGCRFWQSAFGHWAEARETAERKISYVYSGDPRFGGVEPGYVVLGLEPVR